MGGILKPTRCWGPNGEVEINDQQPVSIGVTGHSRFSHFSCRKKLSNGKQRRLAGYRGKVVLLDFWGIWCTPCIHAIPAMKQLHQRYQDDEVVFFSIHTGGSDMAMVKRMVKQYQWQTMVGLDVRTDIASGETTRRYAIQGYPTLIVIDRAGVVTFNSGDIPADRDAFMREMQERAAAIGLPWPIEKDATDEEVIERMTKLQAETWGRMIDQALKTDAE
jgi:thiol-disulfide isomerase/thioredoxin